ncbi:MAG: PilZ domain-containing protein [Candidatus Acidiferrales bacterium]
MTNGKEPTPSAAVPLYGKLRRTQRVHILMGVLVRGTSANKPFEEETKTTTVNAHGCLISLATPVTRGQRVSIVNPKTAEEVECKVAYISENKGSKTEVGLEFTEASPLFWRIGFPPEDWVDSSERKRPGHSHAPGRPAPAGTSGAKNE